MFKKGENVEKHGSSFYQDWNQWVPSSLHLFLIWPASYPKSEGLGVHRWRVPTKLMGRLDLGGIPPIPSGISGGKGRIPPMQTLT